MEGCIPDKSKRKEKNIYLTPEAIRKKNLKNKLLKRYTRTRGKIVYGLTVLKMSSGH